MPLINCEINLILIWSKNSVLSAATGASTFRIIATKLYISVETLSVLDNSNLL